MIQMQEISKEFQGRILFSDVSFNLGPNEKVGFVGRNGTGKSTLFKIIVGEYTQDFGTIVIPKNYKIGYLSQHIHFKEETLFKEGLLSLPADEKFDEYKVKKILFGLGFSDDDLLKNPKDFSGGYQLRINLAKVLLASPNLLLLDEPTNYLDIITKRWLERFLKNYQGEMILITHDRGFMKAVSNSTMGIHRGKVLKIAGNFEKYKEKILEDERVYENTRQNQEKKKKEIEAFVDKFRAKARQASLAQSRLKMLQKMEILDSLEVEQNLNFSFSFKELPSKTILNVQDLSFGYSEKKLFQNLNFHIDKNDVVGVIGKNGKGKSTLLRLLFGELKPNTGSINFHPSSSMGYFGQTNIERLYPENTIVQEIKNTNPDLTETRVRNICGTMMFSGDDALKKIKLLSGGEKSRVLLGKILATETNFLLLDEPTNHLDQESIEALSFEVKNFKGGVILVTHNEDLLRSVANKLIVFHQDKCEFFLGGYDHFLEKIGWEDDELSSPKKEKMGHKDYKNNKANLIKERADETRELKKVISDLELKITNAEERIKELNKKLIEVSEKQEGQKIVEVSLSLKELESSLLDDFSLYEESSLHLLEIEEKFNILLGELEKKFKDS